MLPGIDPTLVGSRPRELPSELQAYGAYDSARLPDRAAALPLQLSTSVSPRLTNMAPR